MKSIEEQIYTLSVASPEKRALIDAADGTTVSYASLWKSIEKAAAFYKCRGLRKGDRVLIAAQKEIAFPAAYFGAHMAGLIAMRIDRETGADRLRYIIGKGAPRLAVGSFKEVGVLSEIDTVGFDCFADGLGEAVGDVEGVCGEVSPEFPAAEDIADILFTTGTTGAPKGVALSYGNEAAAALNINTFIGNGTDDVELIALPISHSFGLGRLRCVLSIGATAVMLGSFASMKRFYKAIGEFGVTGFGMVPAAWAYIRKMSGDRIAEYAPQLRYIEIGSAFMPEEEKRHLISLLPLTEICMHYGLTEASRSSFINFRRDIDHLASAGKASPNVEIAIFSAEGEMLPADTDGEVCVRGAHVCCDYWGESREYFRRDFFGDWFRTGDRGSLSPEGWLSLKGRDKEMINVGGKKVNPIEVESALMTVDGIADCACVARHDDVLGEVVEACIVSSDKDASELSDDQIRAAVGRLVEAYKVPRYIRRVVSIPRTSSGKIKRLELKN